jgi:hypothetical protein
MPKGSIQLFRNIVPLVHYFEIGAAKHMKPLISYRTAFTTLALLTAISVSGCGGGKESASNTTTTTTTTTETTATTPANTSTPVVAQTSQGVAPQGVNCPSGNQIKAVNSKRLGKIVLTTKSPDYKTVKPDKCFPDTASAQQAGYTIPK